MAEHARIKLEYIAGKSDNRILPPMLLTEYPWELVMAKSNIPGQKPLDETQLPVSPDNHILTDEVEIQVRPIRRSFL